MAFTLSSACELIQSAWHCSLSSLFVVQYILLSVICFLTVFFFFRSSLITQRSCGTTKEWRRAARGPMSTSSSTVHNSESKHLKSICGVTLSFWTTYTVTKDCLWLNKWCNKLFVQLQLVGSRQVSFLKSFFTVCKLLSHLCSVRLLWFMSEVTLCIVCWRHVIYEHGRYMFTLGGAKRQMYSSWGKLYICVLMSVCLTAHHGNVQRSSLH